MTGRPRFTASPTALVVAVAVLAVAAVAALTVHTWWCVIRPCDPIVSCPESPAYDLQPPWQEVKTVEIVPAEVTLRGPLGTGVLLEARVRDAGGFEISDAYAFDLTWAGNGVDVSAASSSRTAKVSAGQSTVVGTVLSTLGSGLSSGAANVHFDLRGGSLPTVDRPNVGVADVVVGSGQGVAVPPFAFVGEPPISGEWNFGKKWKSILFLFPKAGPVLFQPAGKHVDAAKAIEAVTDPAPLIDVPITTWLVATKQPTCGSMAVNDHVQWANAAYQRARAGISFAATAAPVDDLASEQIREFCESTDGAVNPPGIEDAMNVYFVDDGPIAGGILDFNGVRRATACIPWRTITSLSVLSHELGHSLGLDHLSDPSGMDDSVSAVNVMSQLVTPERDAPRSRLLPGQIFRVLLSTESWIAMRNKTSWGVTFSCDKDECPPVRLDLEAAR